MTHPAPQAEDTRDLKPVPKAAPSPASILASLAGAMLGAALVHSLPPGMALKLLGGGLAGGLAGTLPYLAAKRKAELQLGRTALISCIGSGLAFGLLLAGPVALVFYVMIERRAEAKPEAAPEAEPTPRRSAAMQRPDPAARPRS